MRHIGKTKKNLFMKVIFDKTQELIRAFEQLPEQEKYHFWEALQAIMPKHITPRDTSLNPIDFFADL